MLRRASDDVTDVLSCHDVILADDVMPVFDLDSFWLNFIDTFLVKYLLAD